MKRGDVVTVTVAVAGDYGKPRPAVIVRSDSLPAAHASVIVCQMTTELIDARHIRVGVDPSQRNGLKKRSEIMVDKPTTIRRERVGRKIGMLDDADLGRLNVALAFVMGLSD